MSHSKISFVSGCANGIGNLLAQRLAAMGHLVYAIDLNLELLDKASGLDSPNIRKMALDVSDPVAWDAVFKAIIAESGRLDYIFNNAGILLAKAVENNSVADIQRQIDINVKGVIYGSTLAAQQMLIQGHGHIINTASLAGISAVPGLSIYCASKFAVRGYTLALAYELKPKGIYVTAICPDAVDTGMTRQHVDNPAAGMVFSGSRMLRREDVVEAMLAAMQHKRTEVQLPWFRGLLSRIAGFWPGLGFLLAPTLTKQGNARQQKLKA